MSTPRMSTTSREPTEVPKHGARSVLPTAHEKSCKNTQAESKQGEGQASTRSKRESEASKSHRRAPRKPPPSLTEASKKRGAQSKSHRQQRKPPGQSAARVHPSDKRRR